MWFAALPKCPIDGVVFVERDMLHGQYFCKFKWLCNAIIFLHYISAVHLFTENGFSPVDCVMFCLLLFVFTLMLDGYPLQIFFFLYY